MGQQTLARGGHTGLAMPNLTWAFQSMVSGALAGMAMAMFTMAVAWIADGYGFWGPPRAIAAVFFGESHLGSDFAWDWVAIGIGIHMALSMAFGMGFAMMLGLAAPRVHIVLQMTIGMVLGIGLWAANTYVFAPILTTNLFDDAMPQWTWFTTHLIFGGMLGLIYAAWRRGGTSLFAEGSPQPIGD